jgi:hypothetical protein
MNIFSKLRRNVIKENNIYKIKDIFGDLLNEGVGQPDIDNPEFYDIQTKTLKLGNLCAKDIKDNKNPNINIGGQLYTTYCALAQLSNTLDPNLVNQFHYNIDKLYNFLRRDLKYDNRVKFHSLIKSILEYDDPANTINIIVKFIEDTDSVDEIANALNRFRNTEDLTEKDIDNFLRFIKSTGHQEYEKSFYGEHFEKYNTKLVLKYKTKEENTSILRVIENVLDGKYELDQAISLLYENINKNYNPLDMIKSDLKCVKDVYDENGDIIINSGSYIEVKKIDYAADSYLSEFMSMYKSSRLPEYVHEPNFLKVYNQIIDGLFIRFESRSDILEDIRKNFAGIIYDNNVFISSDNIELYWSNKGRPTCLKDHRLSIRYRINKSNLTGYVYEGGDVLTKKPINMILSSERLFCPIIKGNKLKESYNFTEISNLLMEGRKEDARKKYPDFSDEIFDFYVENDPSGNQKYLDWLLKHTNPAYKVVADVNEYLLDMIKVFHQYQNMFVNKDINSHTHTTLDREIDDVKEKLLQKEKKKQAKKQSIKLYEDDRWLAISPKSWEASCYYGAGTKWCVTMKDNSSYWRKYTKNATFIFIIDKTKTQEDPMYKVAYRIIGRRGRYELWNAPDYEISKSEAGLNYINELPPELMEKASRLHQESIPTMEGRPEWVDDDPRAQALISHLDSEEIEDVDDYWWGLRIYEDGDGESYAVGSSDEVDSAIYEYYNDYSDEDLIEYYDQEGYHLVLRNEKSFIDSEVEDYVYTMSDDELLEISGLDGTKSSLEGYIAELVNSLDSEEDSDKIGELSDRIEEAEFKMDNLVEKAKEIVSNSLRGDWENCLSDGAVNCFVHEKGWFSSARELYTSGLVDLDRDGVIGYVTDGADYDVIAPYGYDFDQDDDGNEWVIFKIDY